MIKTEKPKLTEEEKLRKLISKQMGDITFFLRKHVEPNKDLFKKVLAKVDMLKANSNALIVAHFLKEINLATLLMDFEITVKQMIMARSENHLFNIAFKTDSDQVYVAQIYGKTAFDARIKFGRFKTHCPIVKITQNKEQFNEKRM